MISFLAAFPLPSAKALEPSERPSADSEAAERTALFIGLLKRRAQRLLEARREPPPPRMNVSAGISEGYESNVNLDGARKGDYFTEESFNFVVRPILLSWLNGELSHSLLLTHFQELTDSNLWMNIFTGGIQFQPKQLLRLDLGAEYGILNFPYSSDSSFFDQRARAHLALAQTPWLTHKIGWTYQLREYDTRKARDSSNNQLPGVNREDQRHIFLYEAQVRVRKASARISGEFYRNFSNEQFQEYYDWENIKLRATLTRIFSPRWFGTFSGSFERKNYERRSVPAIDISERDNLYTLAGSAIYSLNSNVSFTYSLTYRYQDSNDPRLDFTDWIQQVGVTVGF
ncbi:MAG: outer membrane beta-barrel protein [Candidatus Omnitrophica bacterium]|nr:outer membrane beta-barrel protein [Candidatus Omnitrophota bacterium]